MSKPAPGTFKLFPYAEPPLTSGRWSLTGDISEMPAGANVEALASAVDVTGPRFQLPPDQILSTFPPAGARGAFGTRLPQIVIKRRTIPWERSARTLDNDTPEPWLALVLLAEGEFTLRPDLEVAQTISAGVTLDLSDKDVPRTTCLEVPASVVRKVFPAQEDLSSLCHVRLVDLADTELAIGDDDGWMSVVMANRLPQDATKYTACLINLEGQIGKLPTAPEVADEFDFTLLAFDVSMLAPVLASVTSADASVMGVTEGIEVAATIGGKVYPTEKSSSHLTGTVAAAASSGAGWATSAAKAATTTPADTKTVKTAASAANKVSIEHAIAAERSVGLQHALVEPTLKFPVLASWSFVSTGDDDFEKLANAVSSRMLGHVATGPELPDGGEASAERSDVEAPSNRPLPLVAESGHVFMAHETRIGLANQAWYRGPLVPLPTARPTTVDPDGDAEGPLVLAHHADQLRRVTPDGREDLTYATAFEIGRLLALSRPSVVGAMNRWRQQRYAATATATIAAQIVQSLPEHLRELVSRPDRVLDKGRMLDGVELPGPSPRPSELSAAGAGRRLVTGLLTALSEDPTSVAVPVAEPSGLFSASDATQFRGSRAERVVVGLGLDAAVGDSGRVWGAPPVVAERDLEAESEYARADLERLAGAIVDAASKRGGFR